ncbi:RNA polymerase sigma factor [Butyricimonas synergistica]|uniref:RNA polymerase sigma factor n=1 Tax=Butyricimonas synergistica TaxID=544644 RepID=UPI000380DA1B|nr:sigma-70 family RNA polymerase sigma factor [Butyricimonas synergistica]
MGVVIKSDKEFEKFFRENFPAVQAFMRRYTGDDELAADLAQEAFMRVFERRGEIVSVEFGKAFLYTVARHLYWNHCKHQRAVENYFAQLDENDTDDYNFLEEVTRQETIRILYAAIEQLPPRTREIIQMNLKGMNNTEVAEELQISVNTVKDLKKSAYVTLRGLLSKNYFLVLTFLLGD